MPCNPPTYTPSDKRRSLPVTFSDISGTIIPWKKKEKKKKNLNTCPSFICVNASFYRGAIRFSKNSKDPWRMRTERCSATYSMAGCGEIGHLSVAVQSIGCSSPGNQARCCGEWCPGKASILRGDSTGLSSFRAHEGWWVGTNTDLSTLVSIFTQIIPCCMFSSSHPPLGLCTQSAVSHVPRLEPPQLALDSKTLPHGSLWQNPEPYYTSVYLPTVLAGINFRAIYSIIPGLPKEIFKT